MKWVLYIGVLTLAAPHARGDEFDDARLNEFQRQRESQQKADAGGNRSDRPAIDAKAIINDSNSFLKEREPEMTAEEYALYEKVIVMLETNPKFAIRLLTGMMDEKQEPSPAFEFILGNTYYSAGDHARAETLYRSAIDRFPTFLRAWNNLGVLYYTTNRYEDAARCFSRAVVLGDKDPMTLGLLGYCLERTQEVVTAEMAYMQALAGDPENASWKEGLLRIYVNGGQYGRAESLVRRLIKDRPGETRFWLAYAHLLVKDGRKLRAIALLEAARLAKISGDEELLLLGDLYAEQHLVPEAIAVYQHLTRSGVPLGDRKLLSFAEALAASRKYAEAATVLQSLSPALPQESAVTVLAIRAEIETAQKRWTEARQHWQALLALAPTHGKAWLGIGTSHVAENDLVHAAFAFEAALNDPATAYRAHLELANVELRHRHYSEAASHLEKALALQDTEPVRAYLAQIKSLIPPPKPAAT